MNDNRFDPGVWEAQATRLSALRSTFKTSADAVLAATTIPAGDGPVDAVLAERVDRVRSQAQAAATQGEASLADEVERMNTTAANYRDAEDAAEGDIQDFLKRWDGDW